MIVETLHDAGGLNLDRVSSSIVTAIVMAIVVVMTTRREPKPNPAT